MRFRIDYLRLLLNLLLVNVLLLALSQVSCGRRHRTVSDDGLPAYLLAFNASFLLYYLLQPPLRFIEVDKQAGTVTYALLFRLRPVVLDYSRVWSEFTTRPSRTGARKVWSLFLDDKELFFVPLVASGWTKSQFEALNKLIVEAD